MASAGEIGIRLTIKDGQVVSAALGRVGQDIDGLKAPAQRASASVGDLQAALAGIVTVGGAMALIKIADSVTTLNTQLRLSSSSAREAQAAYDGLFQIAQRTRTSFTELGSTYATIARAGSELGVSQTRLLKVTESIGMAMAIGGGSAESMKAALVQLGQGLGSGTLRGEELNSVMEQTPRLARALADGMGVSIGALRSLGEQGKITSEAVISALEKSGPKLAEEMKSATLTVGQSLTVLQNSFANAVGEIDKASHATGTIAGALKSLSGVIDSVGAAAKNNPGATAFVVGLGQGAAGIAVTTAAVYGLAVAFAALGTAAKAHPVILAFSAFATAGMALKQYSDQQRKTADGLKDTIALYEQQNKVLAVLEQKKEGFKAAKQDKSDAAKTVQEGIDAIKAKLPELKTAADEAKAALAELYTAKAGPTQANVRAVDNELAAKVDAEKFAGAKAIDEARKLAKLRTDIIRTGQEEEKALRASFAKTIKDVEVRNEDTGLVDAAKTQQEKLKLQQELDSRLLAQKRETTAALKSFDEAQAKPGQDASKLHLEKTIAEFERAQTASQEYFKNQEEEAKSAYDRGLMDYEQYVKRKEAIDLTANDYSAQIASGELAAVQRSGIAKKDKIAQELKLVEELEKIAAKRVNISQKAADDIEAFDTKAYKQGLEENAKTLESQQELTANLQAQLKDRQRANAEIGLSAKALDELRSKTMKLNAAELERKAGVHADPKIAAEYRAQAAALRGLISANAEGIANASAVAEFSATWQSVDKTAHDVFVNIFEGGQDAFTKLGNVLKASLLDLLYQMTVRKWVFDITASITGQTGATLAGNAIAGVTAGASGASSLGNMLGLGSIFKNGALEIEVSSSTLSAAHSLATAAPYIAAAVAAGAVVSGMIDRAHGSVSAAGTFVYGRNSADGFLTGGRADFIQEGGGGTTKNSTWFDPGEATSKYMSAMADLVTNSVKGWASAIGLSANAVDGYTEIVEASIGGLKPAEARQAIDKAMAGYGDAMIQSLYGEMLAPLATKGEAASATLQRLGTDLAAVNAIMDKLGGTALEKSLSGAQMAEGFVAAAGSLDNLKTVSGQYYDSLYSAQEKASNATKALDNAFTDLGLSTPKTAAELRKLVESQDLSTAAGRSMAVALMSLAPAFQQVTQAAADARTAMLKDAGVDQGSLSAVIKKGLMDGNIQGIGGAVSDTLIQGVQDALYGKMADKIADSFTSEMIAPVLEAMGKGATLAEALAGLSMDDIKSKYQKTVDDISSIFDNAQIASGMGRIKGAIQDLFNTASYSIPKAVVTSTGTQVQVQGSFAVGTPYVPHDMIAEIHEGEAIIPAQFNPFHPSAQASTVPIVVNMPAITVEQVRQDLPGMAAWNDSEVASWASITGYGAVNNTPTSGYYEGGLIADSRNATSSQTNAGWQDKIDLAMDPSRQREIDQRNDLANATDESTKALIRQYYAQLDVNDAATKAAELTKTNTGWQDKIELAMDPSRQREIDQRNDLGAATDETTKALIRQYYAQLDVNDAATKAAELTKTNTGWQDKIELAKDPSLQRAIDQRNDLAEATDETTKSLIKDYYAQLDANAAAQAAAAAANALSQSYSDLKNQIEQANIALAKASGLDSYAEELQTALDLRDHAGDAYYESLYRELQTIRKLTDVRQELNTLEDSALQKQISLKRAQGDGILANALERSAALKTALAPAASAKAELDRSNLSWGTFAAQKNVGVSTQYEGMSSYLADLASQGHSIQGYLYNDKANNGVTLPTNVRDALNEFAQTRRTASQQSSLQGVVDTSAEIVKAYDRNKALEAELEIIKLQDEAYKQNLDAQKAVTDAQKAYADVLKSTISTMRDFIATLDGGASPLQNLSSARDNFQAVAGKAAAGDTSAYKDLTPAAKTLLDLSRNYSPTIQDYRRDEARVRATLNAVIRVNQNELDKLPQAIAKASDPTKDAWLKLQEATAKEADTSIMLTALSVDKAASTRHLRTAEETLADRYLESVLLLEEANKQPLLKVFNDALKTKVDDSTLPEYTAFNLGTIWGTQIAHVLPQTPLTNADLNQIIADHFPGLEPSDFLTALTSAQLTALVNGVMPAQLTAANLVSTTADVSNIVSTQIGQILPANFAGAAFSAQQMMQDAINRAMAAITPAAPVVPHRPAVSEPAYNPALAAVTTGTGTTDWASLSASEAAKRLGISESAANQPHYLSAILQTYTAPAEYAYQKTFGDGIDQKIADLKAYGKAKGFPGFAVGTNLVPHDMLATIHKDEAIIPAPFNPERYAKASGNTVLVEQIQALTAEVARLQKVLEAGQNAIKDNTDKTARMLTRLDDDGIKVRT